jgi:hypothetical protein
MSDPEPVDLSLLDPARDPGRWSQLLDATRARVDAALLQRAARLDPLAFVGAWARPLLAAAAVAGLLIGAAAAMLAERSTGSHPAWSDARRLAALTEGSLGRGRAPTGAELVAALRGGRNR